MTPFAAGTSVLVVGASGFIGRHLTSRCVALGADVTALTRSASVLGPGVTVVSADLRDRISIARALQRRPFHFVFNLGGYVDHTPYFEGGRDVIEQHLTGLMNIIDGIDRSSLQGFLQVGSSDEYRTARAPQGTEIDGTAVSPYALAKRAGTELIMSLAAHDAFPGVVARLFLVYGPGQSTDRLLPQVIRACVQNDAFAVSPGEQVRDFCFVDDVVEGLIEVAAAPRAHGKTLNIASGIPVRIRDVVESVVRLTGGGTPLFGQRPYRAGESMALFADLATTTASCGWRPRTTLEDGLTKTIAAYRDVDPRVPGQRAVLAVEPQ